MSAIGSRQRAAIARIEYRAGGVAGQGTGFAISRDRILTARHVMDAGTGHTASFGGSRAAVALVGGLRSPQVMARLLEEGAADLFALSRPLIAEPDLVNRWADGDLRPGECISWNAII